MLRIAWVITDFAHHPFDVCHLELTLGFHAEIYNRFPLLHALAEAPYAEELAVSTSWIENPSNSEQ
jgi:hypothetical protein